MNDYVFTNATKPRTGAPHTLRTTVLQRSHRQKHSPNCEKPGNSKDIACRQIAYTEQSYGRNHRSPNVDGWRQNMPPDNTPTTLTTNHRRP